MRLLLDLLKANGVVEERNGDIRFPRRFLAVLRFRDLLEMKLDFAGFLINDFADLFTGLVKNPAVFTAQSQLFQLFDFRRALDLRFENYAPTRAWMRITKTLSRYAAHAALDLYDFGRHARVLDVRGNSGEFMLQLCRRHPHLRATVFDLPLVCEIGLKHILGEPERDRIGFIRGDVRAEALPEGYDLILFKSMLHDWPAQEARGFLDKAARALKPGGALVVFERAPLEIGVTAPPMSLPPALLFFRSYRPALDYISHFQALGLHGVGSKTVALDSPSFLASAVKPGR
jgi:SAM-dependent methyltransferase